MIKRLTNNLSLKIIAVVLAAIIWIFVSGVNDPVKTNVKYTVRVEVTNDEYIYDDNKTYQIDDADRNVSVYVTGKQSVVENRTDIAVVADMTQITDIDEDGIAYVPVQLEEVKGISQSDVVIIPQTIPVSIEDLESEEFVITSSTSGTPGSGYEVGEVSVNPETVEISGPASIIKKIKSVVASVSVEGLTTDSDLTGTLTLYDQNGDAMTDSMEYLNVFKTGDSETADVHVDLWKIQDDIQVEANYNGTPASGYMVNEVTTTPQTISVACSDEALEELKENNYTIEIPSDMIDVGGASSDMEANIKLSSLLSEDDGYKLPSDAAQSVMVKISILPYGSKELSLKTSDVNVTGLGDDLRASFSQSSLTIRVSGSEEDLDDLSEDDIQAKIDLSSKVAGEYTVPVTITLPDGYELVETVMATVQLTAVESETETEEE